MIEERVLAHLNVTDDGNVQDGREITSFISQDKAYQRGLENGQSYVSVYLKTTFSILLPWFHD